MPECAQCHRYIVYNYDICQSCSTTYHPECKRRLDCCSVVTRIVVEPSAVEVLKECSNNPLQEVDLQLSTQNEEDSSATPTTPTSSYAYGKRIRSPVSPACTPLSKHIRSEVVSPALSSSSSSDMAPHQNASTRSATAPEWFSDYVAEFRCFRDDMSGRVSNLENMLTVVTKHDEQLIEHKNAIGELQNRLDKQDRDLQDIRSQLSQRDKAELIISGIPSAVKMSPVEITRALLRALDAMHLVNAIMIVREMNIPQNAASAHTNAVPKYRSLVVQMFSSVARDAFIMHRHKLRDLKSQTIFKAGGNAPIFIREMWPQGLFQLWRAILAKQKEFNYLRTYEKDHCIFLIKTSGTEPIPITSYEDLDVLEPFPPSDE